MKAAVHFEKGERFEASQLKLDPATDWETIVEGCHLAAFQFCLAGTEWSGTPHAGNHPHSQTPSLLKAAGAPQAVRSAWDLLELARARLVYGNQHDANASAAARGYVAILKAWALSVRP